MNLLMFIGLLLFRLLMCNTLEIEPENEPSGELWDMEYKNVRHVDIQTRAKACRNLDGKCIKTNRKCPNTKPLETKPGRPYCNKRRRCCYPAPPPPPTITPTPPPPPTITPKHECERPCAADDRRICHYKFHVTEYYTMSRACFDCGPDNLTDCARKECVPADGVPRPIITVNRQLPGPAIQVCEGDHLIVDVYNELLSDTETIHWHGQHQNGSQYMDGVPGITQCPILPGIFRYDMPYLNYGTYWYHSHAGLHRGDGVFGAMVVRRIEDQQAEHYDTDLPRHVLVLNDWTHKTMRAKFADIRQRGKDDYANTILVNGKGRNTMPQSDIIAFPYETIEVTPGKRHRIRIISSTIMTCPIMVSIDNHDFTIIATDGDDITPTNASSLTLYSGERFDIVLDANQEIDNYWIHFNGLLDCEEHKAYQGAILRYIGAPTEEPKGALSYNSTPPPGIHVNPTDPGSRSDFLTMADLKGFNSTDPSLSMKKTDKQFFLDFKINKINNTHLYNPELYPFNAVNKSLQIETPQMNNVSFVFPSSPPLSQPDDEQLRFCRYEEKPPCQGDYCECTYLLEVGMRNTVEIILVDGGYIGHENHPFHLHGYSFYVVAMKKINSTLNVTHVKNLDAEGKIERNLINPILKDTVTIPYGSYTIVRFTADNPGWWLMHCHLNFHVNMGMAAVLHVGNKEDVPTKPANFPTCGNFLPDITKV